MILQDKKQFSDIVSALDELTIDASSGYRVQVQMKLLDKNRKVLVWRKIIGWLKNPIEKKTVMKRKLKKHW